MIAPVDLFLADFAAAGADQISVQVEAGPHLHRSLQTVRGLGKKVGVVLNPATPVSAIENVLDLVDLVLVMSVNPGFGGQAFIPQAIEKVAQVKGLIGVRPIRIEVDGGINPQTAAEVVAAGRRYACRWLGGFRRRAGEICGQYSGHKVFGRSRAPP